jgi:ATP-dependent exoDNAse (exonuclease V) alpha subunit
MDVKNLNKTYEDNDVKLRGIIGFGTFLLALIVITFVLMWILQFKILEPQFAEMDTVSPMAMKPDQKLPPEPRLQAAPGFGVDGPKGRINLELQKPQSEYIEQKKIWDEVEANGRKATDASGKETVTVMPMSEAKAKLIEQGLKSRPAEEAAKASEDAKNIYSQSSAGRVASEIRK